ncbi:hypothetical protein [Streptomyces sp. NPDC014623]|uniref:hypothetical protein n=1 Tax=Streptomyces sp. NPDC014623 TaxID=3364875 RepID=UPI0036FC5290
MRSPARLVTGTAAAALTAAALGLAAPSAQADGLGRPQLSAATAAVGAADCGPEGGAGTGAAVSCDSAEAAVGDMTEDLEPEDLEPGVPEPGVPEFGDLEPAEDPGPADGLEAEDLAAIEEPAWPEEDEAGTGDEAGAVQRPGSGTGTPPGTKPGTRPDPTRPPGTGPESAKPTVPPGHRPTAAPRPSRPSGHVGTGTGGSAAPDTAQLAAGAGLVGAAVVGGVLLLRRRRTDGMRY